MRPRDILKFFSAKRILIPISIGLLATMYLMYASLSKDRYEPSEQGNYIWVDANHDGKQQNKEFHLTEDGQGDFRKFDYKSVLGEIDWTWTSTVWLFVALCMMATRDIAYMYRIRVLTDYKISWRNSFDTIMLWEFASAITPSVVGGSGVAVYIVHKEGVELGRSTAVVMVTALLDELFYIIMVPVIIAIVGFFDLFPLSLEKTLMGITIGTKELFVIGYFFIVVLTSIISIAIFLSPEKFRQILIKLFSIRLLSKWKQGAIKTGDDIVITSKELKGKPIGFWIKAFGATLFSWTARFWVVNFIILAFTTLSLGDHFSIYARQLVMWVIMLISPTPGGSGIAEFIFSGFLKDFIPIGLPIIMALLWRLASYYPYLFIGAVLLPGWIKRTYYGRKLIKFKSVSK